MSLAIALLLLPATVQADAPPVDARAVDDIVREALRTFHVPGVAVGIVRDGKVVYLAGHGVREMGLKKKITPDTVFPIASCTKAFTTTAMAMLVDEGKMGWDDPVRKHVPYFHLSDPLADRDVRLRDLVCHRTGVGSHDMLWYRSPWSTEEIIRRVGLLPLEHPFRTALQYQSVMFMVAGEAVHSATGMPWADFVRKRLFEPLGMTGTTCKAPPTGATVAVPHRLDDRGRAQVMPFYPMPSPNSAGSIHSTARDLCKWLRFQLSDGTVDGRRLVSAANLEETHTPQVAVRLSAKDHQLYPDTNLMSYGMAWVVQDYRGLKLVSHAGAIDGFRVHLTLVPQARLGIVLLCNLHQTRMNQALSNSLIDQLLGLRRKNWNALIAKVVARDLAEAEEQEHAEQARRRHGTKPSLPLSAYAGTYEHPAYGTARIVLKDGGLVWKWSAWSRPLEHYQDDTFTLPIEVMGHPHVVFGVKAGKVERMQVKGHVNVIFHKVGKKAMR